MLHFTYADSFDCSASNCGNEGWLIVNSQYKNYISTANGAPTCGDASKTPFLTAIGNADVLCKCPLYSSITPCICSLTTPTGSTLTISCQGASLNDTRAAAIVGNMDINAPIDTLDMSANQLTKIPTGVGKFSQLVNLRLNNNSVTSIGSGDGLNQLKANVSYLDLSNNLIETIENASLPRKQ